MGGLARRETARTPPLRSPADRGGEPDCGADSATQRRVGGARPAIPSPLLVIRRVVLARRRARHCRAVLFGPSPAGPVGTRPNVGGGGGGAGRLHAHPAARSRPCVGKRVSPAPPAGQ